jgi:hypothetical protein
MLQVTNNENYLISKFELINRDGLFEKAVSYGYLQNMNVFQFITFVKIIYNVKPRDLD